MPNCENGIGLGCNNGLPGSPVGSYQFNIGTSPINQTPMQGSTPDLVNEGPKPNGFISVFPTVLDSVSSAFVDVYGALSGIPQTPETVNVILPSGNAETEEKKGRSTASYLVIVLVVAAIIGLGFILVSRSKNQ